MWILAYSILVHLVFIGALPWLIYQSWRKGKFRQGLMDRFGFVRNPQILALAARKPIWFHAVSVGEAQLLPSLLPQLKQQFPHLPIVVSTNTVTGQHLAKTFSEPDGVFYIPLDFGWAVKNTLKRINPCLLVILETELWPNLIYHTSKRHIPIVLINGRISDKSFPRYRKCCFFLKKLLPLITHFGMRTPRDAERIIQMGAPDSKIQILGNLKFESALGTSGTTVSFKRSDFSLQDNDLVLIGGSTFSGEEEMLLRIYSHCRKSFPNLRLILAPRHPERFSQAKQVILDAGQPLFCRSQGLFTEIIDLDHPPVILLDVMGELKQVYSLCDLVFIGKSMGLTLIGRGGQNPLEASGWSLPVLCGPYMENFRDVVDALLDAGGLIQVKDESSLQMEILDLLNHPDRRRKVGQSGYRVIAHNLGAKQKALALITSHLSSASNARS